MFCLAEVRLKRETGKSQMNGGCAEGCALLQTDLISAVRVKVQTTPVCAQVSGVLCWRFRLHINRVSHLNCQPLTHPPTHPPTHIHLPRRPPSSIDRRQFVLFLPMEARLPRPNAHAQIHRGFCCMRFCMPKTKLGFVLPSVKGKRILQKTQKSHLGMRFEFPISDCR